MCCAEDNPMLREMIELIAITFIPALELRASIPYGILKLGMNWWSVFLICVVANIILGILVYLLLDKVIHLFLRWNWFARIYKKFVERTQRRIHKAVEKWGELGVAIFIGIPLPGSGVYTGGLGSYLLGLSFKKFLVSCIIGCLIAGVAVTLIVVFGQGAWMLFIKPI
jgi:uncharacterized membrane protein